MTTKERIAKHRKNRAKNRAKKPGIPPFEMVAPVVVSCIGGKWYNRDQYRRVSTTGKAPRLLGTLPEGVALGDWLKNLEAK
jgi:hypothetical protein